jgi:hypothetical protein
MTPIRSVLIAAWVLFTFVIYLLQDHFQLDLWQHLACGRYMARTGEVLTTDVFSHTIAGQTFVDQNWLGQIILYDVYALGGLSLLTIFVSALYAFALILILHCCWKRSRHILASILCVILTLALGLENMTLRTQVFSAVFLAAELWVLWNLSGSWKIAAVAFIVLLWTNCHGAFTLGIALPGLFLLGVVIDSYRRKRQWRKAVCDSSARTYFVCVIVSVLVSFCNPQPGHTFSYVAQSAANGILLGVHEWHPARMNSFTGIAFLLSIMASLIAFNVSRRKLEFIDWLLLLAFLFLGLNALRLIIWWGFVLAGVLKDFPEKRLKTASIALFALVVLLTTGSALPLFKKSNPARAEDEEPKGLVSFLRTTHDLGNVFNTMELGGYLIWHGEGKLKVFLDGRIDPFTPEVFRDYLAVTDGREGWNEILEGYQVVTIIASKVRNPTLVRVAKESNEWRETYSDPLVIVLERVRG